MKRFFQMAAIAVGMLVSSQASAQVVQNGGDGACPPDQPCGECWCRYVHYEPCYTCCPRCVEEKVPCKKCCCRYVDKSYQVQRCRYVPQYYCETVCRQEPEYYYVDDCKVCKKWINETKCDYVPRYYWKKVCNPAPAACAPCCQ